MKVIFSKRFRWFLTLVIDFESQILGIIWGVSNIYNCEYTDKIIFSSSLPLISAKTTLTTKTLLEQCLKYLRTILNRMKLNPNRMAALFSKMKIRIRKFCKNPHHHGKLAYFLGHRLFNRLNFLTAISHRMFFFCFLFFGVPTYFFQF